MEISIANILGSFGLRKSFSSFLAELFVTIVVTPGRHCFRQLARHSRYEAHTFSRNFKKEFDFRKLNTDIISKVTPSQKRIAVIDASFLPKSGKHTEGLGKFWCGVESRPKKGLEISLISVVDRHTRQAYALDVRQTPPENTDETNRLDFYIAQLKDAAPTFKQLGITTVVADGFYAKEKFVAAIGEQGLELVGKLRRDARLKIPYTGPRTGKKGRPRQFEGKFDPLKPEILRPVTPVGTDKEETEAFAGVLWSVSLRITITLVLIRSRKNPEKYVLLFSTNPQARPEEIIAQYLDRFQIEFLFRDAKQYLGLGDCQSLKSEVQLFHHQSTLTALNLLKAEAIDPEQENQTWSVQDRQRTKQNQFMLQLVLEQVRLQPDGQLNQQQILQLLQFGLIKPKPH